MITYDVITGRIFDADEDLVQELTSRINSLTQEPQEPIDLRQRIKDKIEAYKKSHKRVEKEFKQEEGL